MYARNDGALKHPLLIYLPSYFHDFNLQVLDTVRYTRPAVIRAESAGRVIVFAARVSFSISNAIQK